jgi:hypothetical protein
VPNAFLSVFRNEADAQTVINASPLRYRLISDAGPSLEPKAEVHVGADGAKNLVTEEGTGEQEKVFELNLSHSQFDHDHYITNGPLFGPWEPVDRKNSFFGGGLEIPRSLVSSGLRDWDTDSRKWKTSRDDVEGVGVALEGLGVRSTGPSGSGKDGISTQWRIEQRRKKRLEKQMKEGVMGGLKKYSEQAGKERGARVEDPGKRRAELPGALQKEEQMRTRDTAFGAWPGKDFGDVQRLEMQKDKERLAGFKDIDARELPMG